MTDKLTDTSLKSVWNISCQEGFYPLIVVRFEFDSP